jgi:hypothetical protein
MSALFPKWTNTVARVMVGAALLMPAAVLGGLWLFQRTPFITGQDRPVTQPLQFDHRHHVSDVGIDCRYCHQTVERSASAGLPSTQVCMNCHSQIWNKSPLLDQVRQSWFADKPIPWNRVHDLPDYVYFNHSIHVNKGVGCVQCHGRVDQMASIEQRAPLTMGWCLECHRDPVSRLQPKERITDMSWVPPAKAAPEQEHLAQRYDVHPRTNCTTCHR